jgi:hypothetical protein
VSLEYLEHLRQDLARATVCRFLVAYISDGGIASIGRHLLTRALRDPRSFGVGSLTCSCGYEPLLKLQRELGDSLGLRLKYFMDPLVNEPGSGEPGSLALFHSKLVYLAQERERKSVVYLGSHNWTRRALGPGGPRNAEASLRLEMELAPEHLDGTGSSLASEVNRHLRQAYDLPACLPATPVNEATFRQWYERGCRRSQQASLKEVTVVLSVRKSDGGTVSAAQWQGLAGHGIYVQGLEEAEGDKLWQSDDRVLVFVWNSEADLRAAKQPILLRCRITTSNAGPDSQRHGTNQSTAPIAGFEAVVFDEDQLAAMQQSARASRSSLTIWSGRPVEVYDFEFPTHRPNSSQVDGGVTPKYQFHLEVEHVVFPADGDRPENPEMVWGRESFAVAESKDSAKLEEIPGYPVTPELEAAIRRCLTETLLIDPEQAKVLPISGYDEAKVGKRVSRHPLNETFIGPEEKRNRDEFYRKVEPGSLVADLDELAAATDQKRPPASSNEPIRRLQRVFTTPLDQLEARWASAATQLQSRKDERDKS